MLRYIFLASLLVQTGISAASQDRPTSDLVVVYKAPYSFDEVKENLEFAITNQGLLIRGTMHIAEMLNRTGKDLGFEKQVYLKAEAIEFCSALLTHRMARIDPRNIAMCPFSIAVYVKTDEPAQVYVAFRKQFLAGDAEETVKAISDLINTIVKEAIK